MSGVTWHGISQNAADARMYFSWDIPSVTSNCTFALTSVDHFVIIFYVCAHSASNECVRSRAHTISITCVHWPIRQCQQAYKIVCNSVRTLPDSTQIPSLKTSSVRPSTSLPCLPNYTYDLRLCQQIWNPQVNKMINITYICKICDS